MASGKRGLLGGREIERPDLDLQERAVARTLARQGVSPATPPETRPPREDASAAEAPGSESEGEAFTASSPAAPPLPPADDDSSGADARRGHRRREETKISSNEEKKKSSSGGAELSSSGGAELDPHLPPQKASDRDPLLRRLSAIRPAEAEGRTARLNVDVPEELMLRMKAECLRRRCTLRQLVPIFLEICLDAAEGQR